MASLQDYLCLDAVQLERFEDMYRRYKLLYTDPDCCSPMLIVNTPLHGVPGWEERLSDPMAMLKAELDGLRPHIEIGDDRVPTVRVQFGTAQIAAAFGCPITVPPDSLPAAAGHVVARAEDVFQIEKPGLDAGWYGKMWDWTDLWLEHLPPGVHIQHPDIQSAFNSAHLIRGNDIFLDLYDCPEAVDCLLDLVTDFMVDVTRHAKALISDDREWFFDWGALWKGAARISNCSIHMIRPQFYRDRVFERDIRFFEAVGGGRMHYCGSPDPVIDDFFGVPSITGLDYDARYHDLWSLSARAPRHVTLLQSADQDTLRRLLGGDWPEKRNIILLANAASVGEGRELLRALRDSARRDRRW